MVGWNFLSFFKHIVRAKSFVGIDLEYSRFRDTSYFAYLF